MPAHNDGWINISQYPVSPGFIKYHHQLRIDGIEPQVLAQDGHAGCFLGKDAFIVCLCIMFCVFLSHLVSAICISI